MECFGNQSYEHPVRETLASLSVGKPEEAMRQKVLANWDKVAKPLDGMGRFEALTAQIGAILGTDQIDLSRKAVVILCADNGVVEEGISQSGQEVTATVARQMARGRSSVGRMAALLSADTIPIDIGIRQEAEIPGLWNRKIRCGTRNFSKEPAMTEEEAIRAIFAGIETAAKCKQQGFQILAVGEMGIGNTTTSSACAAALLQREAGEVTGRGAGLSDEKLLRKQQVIEAALERYGLLRPYSPPDPLWVLETVGGLDLAALAGVCIGGALSHIPIVLDGAITLTAALFAERLAPGTAGCLIPSHKGREPASGLLLEALGLKPVIDGDLALGEGTGAVMMLSLLDLALSVYHSRTTFADIRLEPYKRKEG